ncbi:MAG TPA: flavin reductase family protein [Burkholderiales bacterium]|nr:flavin reductase family protein [Burkholderiales bacterium]
MKTTTELVEETAEEAARPADKCDLRHALGAYATGVVIVSTCDASGEPVGITVNSFASLSLDPPLVLWSLNAQSPSRRHFDAAPYFAINVLTVDQVSLSRRFATRRAQKFEDVPTRQGLGGVPLFEGSAAIFQCRRVARHEGGDHVIYIGEVQAHEHFPDRAPLVFHAGHYRHLGAAID